ncbi:hypothetical protein BCR35DRAFT_303482 [Leucosporidium creatinivorum]|uniref:DUF6534 domain-containing protein n=1 Tax=Leucosporidium creatinivorum TaxID=106004 RepID=A0A1Y2FI22_9BASI|nr:hypothetical protein BCR35DRAFT_303482 [Leucosporidium creatinivorum]
MEAPLDPFAPYNTLQLANQASQDVTNELLGPPLVGWIFHFFFFGLVVNSCWDLIGSDAFRRDTRRMKAMVAVVMLSEVICVGVSLAQCLHYGLSQDRALPALLLILPLDSVPPAVSGTTAFIVQLYLSRRASGLFIHRPVAQRLFRIIITTLCVLTWCSSIIITTMYAWAVAHNLGPFAGGTDSLYVTNVMIGVWNWLSACVDCVITITLWLVLREHVRGFSSATDNLLRRIVALSIRTASLPALMALSGAFMAVVFPKDSVTTLNLIFAFTYPLPSLYALSFLSTLRAREPNSTRFQVEKDNSRLAFPPSSSPMGERQNGATLQVWSVGDPMSRSPVVNQRIELGETLSREGSLAGRERDLEKGAVGAEDGQVRASTD